MNNEKDYLKHISKPTFISTQISDKNYPAFHEIKPVLTCNKPIYVGFTVPELSKRLLYDFHYNFIKKRFDAELLFTDTDSFQKMFVKNLFDLSYYSKDSKFFDSVNEKVIGKMKYESEGKINDEFVGLKSKMHSMKNIDGKESNMAKGVNIVTEFNEFKDTLYIIKK